MSGTYEVAAAFKARLIAASPGAALPVASVAWENKKFTPVVGTRYYSAYFLPGIPKSAGVGVDARNRHVGVFKVSVFDPSNSGDAAAVTEAERIASCFKRGTVLTYSGVTVTIIRSYVSRLGAQSDPAWFQVPVTVEWRADVSN